MERGKGKKDTHSTEKGKVKRDQENLVCLQPELREDLKEQKAKRREKGRARGIQKKRERERGKGALK